MQRACLTAQGRNHDKIQIDDVDYAIKQLQFSFERSTPKTYFAELAKIAITKEIQDDNIGQQMLFSSAVLEYNGSDRFSRFAQCQYDCPQSCPHLSKHSIREPVRIDRADFGCDGGGGERADGGVRSKVVAIVLLVVRLILACVWGGTI
jgi:hypothetical protein